MCETVDAEVKTEALALTELNEAAAVTQMKPSDVSFKGEGKRRVCAAFEAGVRVGPQVCYSRMGRFTGLGSPL